MYITPQVMNAAQSRPVVWYQGFAMGAAFAMLLVYSRAPLRSRGRTKVVTSCRWRQSGRQRAARFYCNCMNSSAM